MLSCAQTKKCSCQSFPASPRGSYMELHEDRNTASLRVLVHGCFTKILSYLLFIVFIHVTQYLCTVNFRFVIKQPLTEVYGIIQGKAVMSDEALQPRWWKRPCPPPAASGALLRACCSRYIHNLCNQPPLFHTTCVW